MNMLLANGFAFYLKNVFADWAIALFMFFAVLIVLAVLFKGPKPALILLITATVIAGGFVLAAFITMIVTWDTLRLIDLGIKWGPTVLFVGIITVSTLINAKRGLHKSLILLAHAVGACLVCVIVYYICSTTVWADKAMLWVTNGVLEAVRGNTLQGLLGVSESCGTLREILAAWLPTILGGDFEILLAANPQYIVTLADMGFRIVFAVLCLLLYYGLVFFMYIVYHIFYPERRYKKKVNIAVTNNAAHRTYRKHRIGGAMVGLVRGVTVGLLSLSFIGSAFYIAAGGKGKGSLGDYDFENDNYNAYYSIYRSIDSYGAQGIFKLLNMMTDAGDTPFYLFAADMVLSGTLNNEENEIDHKTIKFREELAALTGFAKDTLNLLMKYGEDDVTAILSGGGGSGAFDTLIGIMAVPDFRTEFDLLIEEFDTPTYVINLGMSLVNSIVANIDDLSFASSVSEDNKDLMKLLFKQGHLSDRIPDEHQLKADIADGKKVSAEDVLRPRIKVSHLLNKKDVRILVNVALSFLAGEPEDRSTVNLVRRFLPDLQQLSILDTARASELDPVFARLYCYLENRYLTAEDEEGVTYAEIKDEKISWLEEINVLLDVSEDALSLYGRISQESKQAIDMMLAIFAPGPDYDENVKCYDNIRHAVENSGMIGQVMSTSFLFKYMKKALTSVSENMYIPDDLVYSRKVYADGSVNKGELYYFLGGFKMFNSLDRDLLDKLLKQNDAVNSDILGDLAKANDLPPDEDGNTVASYFTDSYLLRSLISIIMIERGKDSVSVPTVSLEKGADGEIVNVINKAELKELIENLSDLAAFVKPPEEENGGGEGEGDEEIETYADDGDAEGEEGGEEGDSTENSNRRIKKIAEYLRNPKFGDLVKGNRIFEGTVALFLSKSIRDNTYVVVPRHLVDPEAGIDGWVTTVMPNGSKRKGELRNLVDSLIAVDADLEDIFVAGTFGANKLFNQLITQDRNKIEAFLASDILHYVISDHLLNSVSTGGIELIVTNGAKVKTPEPDVIPYTIKRSELVNLFIAIAKLDLTSVANTSVLLSRIVANKAIFDDSPIMAASIVHALVTNKDITKVLTIPKAYLAAGEDKSLLEDFNSSNIWKVELPRFIDALDELIGISTGEGFVFGEASLKAGVAELITNFNGPARLKENLTKLELCYLSDIARSTITESLDKALSSQVSKETLDEVKAHGYYRQSELEAFFTALQEMGVTDLNGLENFDATTLRGLDEPSAVDPEKTRLEVISASFIARAMLESSLF